MSIKKRATALFLALFILCSMVCTPASAISVDWISPFSQFTQIYAGSTETGYIKALQRFLYCYPSTFSLIANNGGIDGIFGNQTKEAVITYQKVEWPNNSNEWDGIVGSGTWGKIARRLNEVDLENKYDYDLMYGNEKIYLCDTRAEGYTYYSYNVTSSGTVYKEPNWFAQK